MKWDDLRFFLAIARAGSLTAAARRLRTSQATVSRRLASLEKELGVYLFERTRRGYEPTEAGREILDIAEHVEDEFGEIDRRLFAGDRALAGILRVTCTQQFADQHLCRLLSEFVEQHPDIHFRLYCTYELLSLARRETDVAVRLTREPPKSLIAQRIAKVAISVYGSPDYLRARPIRDWDWIGWRDLAYNQHFILDRFPNARIKHFADDVRAMQTMARHGLGIAALPCHLADTDPALRRIVPEPMLNLRPDLWVIYHPDSRLVTRVRLFVDFLVERLRAKRDLFEGSGAVPPAADDLAYG